MERHNWSVKGLVKPVIMSIVSVNRVGEDGELGMVAKMEESCRPYRALLTNNIKLVRTGDKSQSSKAGTMIRVTRQFLMESRNARTVFCFRTETEIPVYLMVRSTNSYQSQYFTHFCHKHFKTLPD